MREERRPPEDEVVEVAPGVLRIQLPMNMPGLGHVNCYAVEDRHGIALIDPGTPSMRSWRVLLKRLEEAGLPLKRVHTVVVTHSHPDHYGAAQRIRERSGAELITHENFKTYWDPHEEDDFVKEVAASSDYDVQMGAIEQVLLTGHPARASLALRSAAPLGRPGPRPRLARADQVAHRAADAHQGVAAAQAVDPGHRRRGTAAR